MARRAKVVRNMLMPDFSYAVAVQFEEQNGSKNGVWETAPMTGQVRVLAVESDPKTVCAVKGLLESDGYHVVFVIYGAAGT